MIKAVATWAFRLVSLVIVAGLGYGWWATQQAQHYQTDLGPAIEALYGFTAGTPMVRAGEQSVEVLAIYPAPEGRFATAGFRQDDVIMSHTLTGLYKQLHRSEQAATFDVVHGGDGAPLHERPQRTIVVVSAERNGEP